MPLKIHRFRTLQDNYCFLLHEENSRAALVIDPGEAAPVLAALDRHSLELSLIINTHHHHDHIGGNSVLKDRFGCEVFCSLHDLSRIPSASRGLVEGEVVAFAGLEFRVLAIPGHTQGQIALHFERDQALFAGDTIFEMGCGRLFEGTPTQMWNSFQRLRALPEKTRLFFGHEYTERNAAFALDVEPGNAVAIERVLLATREALAQTKLGPVPTLAEELLVNPFFRAKDVAAFAELRAKRDTW